MASSLTQRPYMFYDRLDGACTTRTATIPGAIRLRIACPAESTIRDPQTYWLAKKAFFSLPSSQLNATCCSSIGELQGSAQLDDYSTRLKTYLVTSRVHNASLLGCLEAMPYDGNRLALCLSPPLVPCLILTC